MHSALVSFIGGGSPGWDPSDGHVAMSWDESPSAERDPFADIRAGWGDAPPSQERAATPQPT